MSESRREFWKRHADGYACSGVSQREYAERHGLNAGTLSWWRWKLNRDAKMQQQQQQASPAFVPVRVVPEVEQEQSCELTWEPREQSMSRALRITLPNGVLMDFEATMEFDELARFAAALGGL